MCLDRKFLCIPPNIGYPWVNDFLLRSGYPGGKASYSYNSGHPECEHHYMRGYPGDSLLQDPLRWGYNSFPEKPNVYHSFLPFLSCPADTQRCFNVQKTLCECHECWIDVELTFGARWVSSFLNVTITPIHFSQDKQKQDVIQREEQKQKQKQDRDNLVRKTFQNHFKGGSHYQLSNIYQQRNRKCFI